MRRLVAIVAVPLRLLSDESARRPDRTEPAGEVDSRAEKLRRAKKRAESVGTPASSQPVPDGGVVCSDERDRYLFASAADTCVLEFSNTTVTDVQSGEWIESDAAIDVEGWA